MDHGIDSFADRIDHDFQASLAHYCDALLIDSFSVQFARWQVAGTPMAGDGGDDERGFRETGAITSEGWAQMGPNAMFREEPSKRLLPSHACLF